MNKHDFKLPQLNISVKVNDSHQAIVSTFLKDGDLIKSKVDIPSEFKNLMSDENCSLFIDNKYHYFVYLKDSEKKPEDVISKAIASIPSKIISIAIEAKGLNIKKLATKTAIALSSKWSAKTKKETKEIKNITFICEDSKKNNEEMNKGFILAEAMSEHMRLVESPSNYLTPFKMLEEVELLLESPHVKISSIKGKDLETNGFGALYAVSKGSINDGYLITIEYNPPEAKLNARPIVFVGKGLTFDSGGISLKPSKGMGRMKGDMGGAATVISALLYAIKTNSEHNIVGIIATCENMPDGNSLKPGDVITAKNGKTIEVEDTDAEGRLVLADALCHAATFNGIVTIDFATLTGAVISALGHIHTGLFSDDDFLANQLIRFGSFSGDTVWRLPLCEDYNYFLKSDVADLNNLCLGQGAGATNGAIFLKEFAPEKNWVHLDIAGTCDHNGATGRPVTLIAEMLDNFS